MPKRSGPEYVVLHDGVGGHVRGERVPASELATAPDGKVDQERLDRLVELGAVAPADSDAAQAVAPPAVPTLADALRSDSPPTLPQSGPVEVAPGQVVTTVDPAPLVSGGTQEIPQ